MLLGECQILDGAGEFTAAKFQELVDPDPSHGIVRPFERALRDTSDERRLAFPATRRYQSLSAKSDGGTVPAFCILPRARRPVGARRCPQALHGNRQLAKAQAADSLLATYCTSMSTVYRSRIFSTSGSAEKRVRSA